MWMRPAVPAPIGARAAGVPAFAPIAGGSPEADPPPVPVSGGLPEVFIEPGPPAGISIPYAGAAGVAALFAAANVFFGIFPSPLFRFAAHAGRAIVGLF